MKKFALLCILMALAMGCKEKNSVKKTDKPMDSLVIYSEDDWYKIKYGKIKVVDTACLDGEKRAHNDIKEGNWKYTFLYGLGSLDYSNKEMKALLATHSIVLDSIIVPCARSPKGFRWHCYADLMNAAVEKKFGKNFIDSLRHVADVAYIKNHPERIFYWHQCDTESRYAAAKSYDDYLKMPEYDFIKTLHYPKLTKSQVKKLGANTEVTFILYKNGTVGNITVKSNFSDVKDVAFARYFEQQAIAFVKNAKWKPGTYRGIAVNSDMHLNLYNK